MSRKIDRLIVFFILKSTRSLISSSLRPPSFRSRSIVNGFCLPCLLSIYGQGLPPHPLSLSFPNRKCYRILRLIIQEQFFFREIAIQKNTKEHELEARANRFRDN